MPNVVTHPKSDQGREAAANRFYTKLFGIDCRMGPGWVVTLEPGCAPMAEMTDPDAPDLVVEVPDLCTIVTRARQIGAEPLAAPSQIRLMDPDGTGVIVRQSEEPQARAA